MSAIAGLRGGRLRMASFPTAGATLMPLAIATFRASYPDVELRSPRASPRRSRRACAPGELDLALLFEFDGQTPLQGDMTAGGAALRTRCTSRCRAITGWRGGPRSRLSELDGEAWVQTSRSSPCAQQVMRSCHAAGFEPNVAFESDDYQTVQGLVAAGVGVALIPQLALSVVREDIVIRPLSPAPPAPGDRGGARGCTPGPCGAGDALDPARGGRRR